MARKMTATEAKAGLLALLDEVAAGEEIEITKHGRVVALLSPARGPRSIEGRFQGVAVSNADEDDLFSTEADWEVSP